MMRGLTANWILLGDGRALRDGSLVVDSLNTIVAVGPRKSVFQMFAHAQWSEHQGVLMPGLCNMHTHLELSILANSLPRHVGFYPWMRALLQARADFSKTQIKDAARASMHALTDYGTAFVADIGNTTVAIEALQDAPYLSLFFLELLDPEGKITSADFCKTREQLKKLSHHLTHLRALQTPHSLYGTHAKTIALCTKEASSSQTPMSIHFAEHSAERQALDDNAGPLAEMLQQRYPQLESPALGRPLLESVENLQLCSAPTWLIHGTRLSPEEIQTLAQHGAEYVLCPRSNRYIEQALPNLEAMLSAGSRPGLGTDSLASNTDLDVLREAAELRAAFPEVNPATLVAMATSYGARLARVEHTLGQFKRGARPGVLLITFHGATPDDPHAAVLEDTECPRQWLAPSASSFVNPGIQ